MHPLQTGSVAVLVLEYSMSDEAWKSNSLAELAEHIRAAHGSVRNALRSAVERAMATGDLLIEVKSRPELKHGQWTPWLREHCEMSERTARLYMRLAKNRKVIEACEDAANLTLNAAARLLAPPKEDEKEDDLVDSIRDELIVLYAAEKMHVVELIRRLHIAKAHFGDKWLEFLQQNFPEPTDPLEKEASNLMGEVILAMARDMFPEEDK
jgi:hypothetical protein